jgi:hypothetical protein
MIEGAERCSLHCFAGCGHAVPVVACQPPRSSRASRRGDSLSALTWVAITINAFNRMATRCDVGLSLPVGAQRPARPG